MNTNIDYGLEGAFKVDYFKSGESRMAKTTDWFSNFITPTGLIYPLDYSFADCFRYLSIGTLSVPKSGATGLGEYGTTGLSGPISSYKTNQGTSQNGQYIDWRGYATGNSSNSNCGTLLLDEGIRLYRGWHIPTGGDDHFMQEDAGSLTIQEFMVSPSSGQDPVGKSAFSRITRNLSIPNGYRVVISYQLKVNIKNTGATYFGPGTFSTGEAEVENDANLVRTWANLSGYYKQVCPGLRFIDNHGVTYVSKYGDGMEPASERVRNMIWYLSPDNSQFDISNISGGSQSSVSSSYKSDGVMSPIKIEGGGEGMSFIAYTLTSFDAKQTAYNNNNPTLVAKPDNATAHSIRIGRLNNGALKLPQLDDYKSNEESSTFNYQISQDVSTKSISYATPGVIGYNTSYSDFGKKAIFSSPSVQLPISTGGQNAITGRKKTVTRRSLFSPVSSLGHNTRFGSLVYAFINETPDGDGDDLYYPIIDTLFYDSSGKSLMPHYRFITGVGVSERGSGLIDGYFTLSGNAGGVYKFTTKSGFYGPYSANPLHNILTSSGVYASGTLNSNAYGNTGVITANLSGGGGAFTATKGWGALYGLEVGTGFHSLPPDLGLSSRSTGNLNEPSSTGQLYWPLANNGYELNFVATGLKYYHPDVVEILPDTGWFGQKQILKSINFEAVQSGAYSTVITPNGFVKTVTGARSSPFSGYFLTNKQFSGNAITVASDVITNGNFTGYIIPYSLAITKVNGTLWNDPATFPSSDVTHRFIPPTGNVTLATVANCKQVTGLWADNITDRGFPITTSGGPFNKGDDLRVVFTGFSAGSPVYLTYVSGNGNTVSGQSFMSGTVALTDFTPPKLYPLHFENYGSTGFRLATNFAPANYYGADIYAASEGGQYPATSFDNGLEVYLSLQWSANCGSTVKSNSCLDPV